MSAAILVGGEARRLGGAVKPNLRVGGERILDRQLRVLHDAGVDHILMIGRWPEPPVRTVHHVADAIAGAGALGGVYTALLAATRNVVLVVAGDMPFLTPAWVRALADLGAADVRVPRQLGRWHPLCAAYRRSVALAIKRRLDAGSLRVTDALAEFAVREVTAQEITGFDTTGQLLMNVNTPDDYREAERHARSQA